jgi:hypothetical protein
LVIRCAVPTPTMAKMFGVQSWSLSGPPRTVVTSLGFRLGFRVANTSAERFVMTVAKEG